MMKQFRTPPHGLKDNLAISFSGGKSSAYMTKMLLDHFRVVEPERKIIVIFANTGQEHDETLNFIHRCDQEFRFGTVWIEPVTNPRGIGMSYQVVNFVNASRNGEPFEKAIQKYGIFNKAYPGCTNKLKVEPMQLYLRDNGFTNVMFAVGIRADEIHRASGKSMDKGVFYPLVDAGVTKEDVREWWEQQPFNLNIPEHLGNCKWCWKKSDRKLLTIARNQPEFFEFPAHMEAKYAQSGGLRRDGGGVRSPQVFFRRNRSTKDILREAKGNFELFVDDKFIPYDEEMDEHGSCGDSCEVGADKNDLEDFSTNSDLTFDSSYEKVEITAENPQSTNQNTNKSNMKDILALITRLVVALEVMAQSMSGKPIVVDVEDTDAEETKTPAAKATKGKAAKPAKEEPKVDYAALREEGDTLIKGMAQNKGVPVPELKAIIAKHGAAKFSEASDDKLEAIVADLRARNEIADSEV